MSMVFCSCFSTRGRRADSVGVVIKLNVVGSGGDVAFAVVRITSVTGVNAVVNTPVVVLFVVFAVVDKEAVMKKGRDCSGGCANRRCIK